MAQHIETEKEKRTASGLNQLAAETMPLLRRLIDKKNSMTIDIFMYWKQIVGDEMAEYSLPEKIAFRNNERKNGVLTIAVANGAFALEIQHREKFILEKINSFFGYQAVGSIRIRQSIEVISLSKKQFNQFKCKKKLVSKQEQNYITQLTDGLVNADLQKQLQRLGESVFSENNETKQESK